MSTNTATPDLGPALGMMLARIWLGVRALQGGIEKFALEQAGETVLEIDGAANPYGLTEATRTKVYGLEHYQGVPKALYDKFGGEPLIPGWLLGVYDLMLGPALLILGLTVLLGVATRISLFAMGLLYTSLTVGLVMLKQDAGVAWLAVHVVLVVLALMLAKHNRFALCGKW